MPFKVSKVKHGVRRAETSDRDLVVRWFGSGIGSIARFHDSHWTLRDPTIRSCDFLSDHMGLESSLRDIIQIIRGITIFFPTGLH